MMMTFFFISTSLFWFYVMLVRVFRRKKNDLQTYSFFENWQNRMEFSLRCVFLFCNNVWLRQMYEITVNLRAKKEPDDSATIGKNSW